MENWKRAKEMHRLTNPPQHPARGVAAPGNGLKAGGNRGPTSVVTVAHVAQVLPLLPADGSCRAPLPHTRSPRGGCVQGPDRTAFWYPQPRVRHRPAAPTPRSRTIHASVYRPKHVHEHTRGAPGGLLGERRPAARVGTRSPGMDSRVRLPAGSGSAAPSDLPLSRSLAPILSNK